jgi:hypothetical protein
MGCSVEEEEEGIGREGGRDVRWRIGRRGWRLRSRGGSRRDGRCHGNLQCRGRRG